MKKVSLVNTKRGYQYVKKYGMAKLYLKARERLERNRMERGYQQWMLGKRPADSEKELRENTFFVESSDQYCGSGILHTGGVFA